MKKIHNIFPEILNNCAQHSRCYGAWTPEKRLIAAAICAQIPGRADEVTVPDLCVDESYRSQGVARALIQNLAADLSAEGAQTLRMRCMGSANQLTGVYELLISAGMVPTLLTGRIMNWQMMDWSDSPLTQQMKTTPVPTDFICDAQGLTEHMRTTLTERAGDYDPDLSRFYIIDGKLMGALCVRRIGAAADGETDAVVVYRTYVSPALAFLKVYVPMIASLYQELKKVLPEEAAVSVASSDHAQERALRRMFDEPDSESLVQEYERVLRDGEGTVTWQAGVTPQEQETIIFGWLDDAQADIQPAADAQFQGAGALYAQETPETDNYIMQPEFLRSCANVTDEDTLRREWNEWLTMLRRETWPADKKLPFAAYQEQLDRLAATQAAEQAQTAPEKKAVTVDENRLTYFLFPEQDAQITQLLPDYLLRAHRGHRIAAARDESGVLYGYAAFYRQNSPQKTWMLEYLYVGAEYRGHGIGGHLLRFAKEVFSEAGYRGITAKQAGSGEHLLRMHEFLKYQGFVPVTLSAHTMLYYLQDLAESHLMRLNQTQSRQLPAVVRIENRDDYRLLEFAKECRANGFRFEMSHYDTEYTWFYVEQNRIRGVMGMEQAADNMLMMIDTYIARDVASHYVQPALLLAVLNRARKHMRDDAVLILQLYDGWNLQAMETLLGESEQSLRLCEYVMPFR